MREAHRTFQIGQARITQLVELRSWRFSAREWFPDATEEQLALGRERYPEAVVDGTTWVIALRNYVIELGDKLIVVDTCAGNHKQYPSLPEVHQLDTDYFERFALAGFDPERVDVVINTHLHADHCGWNTRLVAGEWLPSFPNATYLLDPAELAFIEARAQDMGRDDRHLCRESVLPVLERAKHDVLGAGEVELAAFAATRVVATPTPGHTPGHRVVEVLVGRDGVILSGDVIHHPFQAHFPDLRHFADADPAQAARTRRALLSRCADEGLRLCTAHVLTDRGSPLQDPLAVVRDGAGGFAWAR